MKATFFFAAALIATLPGPTASAKELHSTWVSEPRGLVTIVIEEDGGRLAGPGWERKFDSIAKNLDIEIAPGRRFLLRRRGNIWVGEYFHPGIVPGTRSEAHLMTFSCGSGGCADGK